MAIKYKLDEEAREQLSRREYLGKRCAALAFDGPWTALDGLELDDLETYARDAVSHILTALFGPAGYCVDDSEVGGVVSITLDEERGTLARTFLDMAYESWEGDAEDYTAEAVTVDNPLLGDEERREVYRQYDKVVEIIDRVKADGSEDTDAYASAVFSTLGIDLGS